MHRVCVNSGLNAQSICAFKPKSAHTLCANKICDTDDPFPVLDRNDNKPIFSQPSYTFTGNKNIHSQGLPIKQCLLKLLIVIMLVEKQIPLLMLIMIYL